MAAGEAFDPSVHAWDAATTYEDWKRAYTEVYSELPPDSILPQAAMGLFNVKQDSHTSVRVCGCVYGECGGGAYRCGCEYGCRGRRPQVLYGPAAALAARAKIFWRAKKTGDKS